MSPPVPETEVSRAVERFASSICRSALAKSDKRELVAARKAAASGVNVVAGLDSAEAVHEAGVIGYCESEATRTGSFAVSHPAMPPAISLTRSNPCC